MKTELFMKTMEVNLVSDLVIWDILNSITMNKKDLSDHPDFKSLYKDGWPINSALSLYPDTILYAQEMNMVTCAPDMKYSYLINSIRPRKRKAEWPKKKEDANLELIREYYGYNKKRCREALKILSSEEVEQIRKYLDKGGAK